MSFKLFGIEFDGKKDCNSIGKKRWMRFVE
jgi:hypothetical protein